MMNAVTKAAARIAVGTSVDRKDDKPFGASLASPVCPPCYDAISPCLHIVVSLFTYGGRHDGRIDGCLRPRGRLGGVVNAQETVRCEK